MDVLLVALHVLFLTPVFVRLARGRARRSHRRVSADLSTVKKPQLVLHGTGLLLLWAGVAVALVDGQVARRPTVRGFVGATLLLFAVALMGRSMAALRSWRLLPKIDADHQLCTTGPYAFVRHPMYLALDVLAVGSAVWVPTVPVVTGALLLIVGGELRARLEEQALAQAFGERYRDYAKRVPRRVLFG